MCNLWSGRREEKLGVASRRRGGVFSEGLGGCVTLGRGRRVSITGSLSVDPAALGV